MSQWWREEDVSWFYVVSKQQMGPVPLQGLVDLWEKGARGGIGEGTLLWTEHMSGWMQVKDFAELHELLQLELKNRRAIEPSRTAPCVSGAEAGGSAGDTSEPCPGGTSSLGGKASGTLSVIAFLRGWLPKRADKEDLLKRGILRKPSAHPLVATPKAASSDDLYGGSLNTLTPTLTPTPTLTLTPTLTPAPTLTQTPTRFASDA